MNDLIKRHKTKAVKIGLVSIGANQKIVVQSMTDTDTKNIKATTEQIKELSDAGAEIVRITVNNEEAAKAVPYIIENLRKSGYLLPIVGDFHYNGHILLEKFPDMAQSLDKFRINPGNVGFKDKQDKQFSIIIEHALKYDKPVRIGVNWGSIDQNIAARLMDENNKLANPLTDQEVLRRTLVESAIESANRAQELGMCDNKIVISCKVSYAPDLVMIYRDLAKRSNYALHLGLTEAGIGSKGLIASSAAIAILLSEGIGDTIRTSITPAPTEKRTKEVIASQELLQSLGLRRFVPSITSCPGCGRTSSSFFRELTETVKEHIESKIPIWRLKHPGVENINIAVMGCIVNGPGESKHANIGISLPGNDENPAAPVYIDGIKTKTLRGENIKENFLKIIDEYVENKFFCES